MDDGSLLALAEEDEEEVEVEEAGRRSSKPGRSK